MLRAKALVLEGEDGERLTVEYDNRGEPFREGVAIQLHHGETLCHLFLAEYETGKLRDKLTELLPDPRLKELRDAVAFFDKVKSATQAEQIAVGTDHWDRLEKAARALCIANADGRK